MNKKGVTSKGSEDLNAIPLDFESISCLKTKSILRKTKGAVRFTRLLLLAVKVMLRLVRFEVMSTLFSL